MLSIHLITLFPEMFDVFLSQGVVGRAIEQKKVSLSSYQLRDFADNSYRKVDDRPYGGGAGMLLQLDPLLSAINFIENQSMELCSSNSIEVVNFSPKGIPLTHQLLMDLRDKTLILLSGRYEGIDQRVIDQKVTLEVSVGDFVLSGGEVPSMLLIDALVRLHKGTLGNEASLKDSFSERRLSFPQYTRSSIYGNEFVPEVLLSGDLKKIEQWRLYQSLGVTWQKRPDLLVNYPFTLEEFLLLEAFKEGNEL